MFYLKYDMYRNNWPLVAMATYANMREGIFRPTHMHLKPSDRIGYYPKLKKLAPQLVSVFNGMAQGS